MNDVVFEQDLIAPSRPLLSAGGSSPVTAALVRARVVPNERAARFVIVAVALVGVGGAFASIYATSPDTGVAGATYESLSSIERAEIPPAERAYLERSAAQRRAREAEAVLERTRQ